MVDARGLPHKLSLTAGQTHESTQAKALLSQCEATVVIADKGYDFDCIIDFLESKGTQAVIPPRSTSKKPRGFVKDLYKERNLIERFFNKIKHRRRIATRYDKLAQRFLSMLTLAAILLWIKV